MILLSFDTEEFDVPRESGIDFPIEESMKVSRIGTTRILDILQKHNVRATFFCTTTFAKNAPDVIQRILSDGHEIAAHGCDHWRPNASDVFNSKQELERITGKQINGYRQPRMFPVNNADIKKAGYVYNSSLNPCFIPGKYNNIRKPRRFFLDDGVLQIPASVTPWLRFPLFWLSLHNLPLWLYKRMVRRTLNHDGYFTTYFHPWEFYDLSRKSHPEFHVQYVSRVNTGDKMVSRFDSFVSMLTRSGYEFGTYSEFAEKILRGEIK